MAASYIGKPISLISHSDVRYRGILAGIDPQASTIQLSNVFSMGTESRKPAAQFIPPVHEPYEYIIFRASEVKDLAVEEQAPITRNVHDDPAVLNAGQPTSSTPVPQTANYARAVAPQPQEQSEPTSQRRRNSSLHTAAASLETVERAIGDLRVSNPISRRNGRPVASTKNVKIPAGDFDFQGSNARFDKAALGGGSDDSSSVDTNPEEEKKEKEKKPAYNPQKSFFDTLTPGPRGGVPRGGRGGGRGRRGGREEEREKNVATFGEPGGGSTYSNPGMYGGYGRRGGRPRRGNHPGNAGSGVAAR